MKFYNIACDVDGVCADYCSGFIREANRVLGTAIPDHIWTNYSVSKALGLTKEQASEVFTHILAMPDFNESLPEWRQNPGFVRYLNQLYEARKVNIVFITARPEHTTGQPVARQTARWLASNGFPDAAVIVAERKGDILRALNIDVFIDDKPENCIEARQALPSAHIFMPVTAYNECRIEDVLKANVVPVASAFEAMNWLERLEEAA